MQLDPYFGEDRRTEQNIAKKMHTTPAIMYVVVASILSYAQVVLYAHITQRVEIISMPEISVIYLLREMRMVRGQNKTEVIKEVIVNFLNILGPRNIFYYVFIEIELILKTLKLCGSH